ncbi:MAG TPA: chromate efflux transporter, partial [Flavisolibacter sp.]|nr:chromate efflux transporter [Flavisolibacter sp.]
MIKPPYSLRSLIIYYLKLGATGFGGPVALVGHMHRDLVIKNNWIKDEDYKEGLALAQLAPGPLAAQLAIYIGYIDYKIIGGTLVGLAFILPSFLVVLILGFAYVNFGGLPWMQAVFYGIGPAIIGIICISSYKLTRKSLGKDVLLWSIFIVLAINTVITEKENLWLVLLAGAIVWFFKIKTNNKLANFFYFLPPVLLQVNTSGFKDSKLGSIAWFFFK